MDALFLDYATGALSEPARLLVDTHLAMRPERRLEAALWEAAGASVFEADAEPVDQDALNAVLSRLERRDGDAGPAGAGLLPGPLGQVVGAPADALPWRAAGPGTLEFVLPRWPQARLIRLTGPSSPERTLGPELGLVLQGALATAGAVSGPGDLLWVDRAEAPPELASGACVYFSVQDSGYSARGVRAVVGEGAESRRWAWR